MPPLFIRAFTLIAATLIAVPVVTSQNLIQGTDLGIHVFGTRPNIQASDSRMGTLVHAYLRRQLGERTQHEFNIGLGLIQGVDFKTRILPVDYRVLAFPFSYSKGQIFPGLHYGDMYAFAGLGFVNSTPIEIPRPDDPLTVDAGPTLRSTEFLDLTTNWSVQLPVGIGTSIHLDDETQMVFNAGYQITTSRGLDGYFAMSVGLKFNKPFRPRRVGYRVTYPLQASTTAFANLPTPKAKTPVAVEHFEPKKIYFESSMSSLHPAEFESLDAVARYAFRHPNSDIVLRAHADSSGHASLNVILAEDRAWKATVELLKMGVAYDRIIRESYGSVQPAELNTTPEGRAQNRRLEIEVRQRTNKGDQAPSTDASNTEVLSMGEDWRLELNEYASVEDVAPSESMVTAITAVAQAMRASPEIRISIEAYHPFRGSEASQRLLATAQASRIQRLLIEQGVDVSRIETTGHAGGPRRTVLLRVSESR